jgi:hypothetical protein
MERFSNFVTKNSIQELKKKTQKEVRCGSANLYLILSLLLKECHKKK